MILPRYLKNFVFVSYKILVQSTQYVIKFYIDKRITLIQTSVALILTSFETSTQMSSNWNQEKISALPSTV